MKRFNDSSLPDYIVSILCLFMVLFMLGSLFFNKAGSGNDFASRMAFLIGDDPDSVYKNSLEYLPYREYKLKADSISRIQEYYTKPSGGYTGIGPFGVGEYGECDTCRFANLYRTDPYIDRKYYFVLGGFKVAPRPYDVAYKPVFYKKLGKSYIKYPRFDTLRNANSQKYLYGHWVSKAIRYRIADDNSNHNPEGQKLLLIPISESGYNTSKIACYMLLFIYLVLFVFIVKSFILMLVDLAKGNAFTVRNYTRLFFISYAIGLTPLLILVPQLILQWIFMRFYTGDLVRVIDWNRHISWLLAALVVYSLARAFKKGYRIQQEQDLTI